MAAPETWRIRATLSREIIAPGAAPYYIAERSEDGAYAILKQLGAEWSHHGPAVTVERALRTAEHVAAGNPRALTHPETAIVLATAVLALTAAWNIQHAADAPVDQVAAAAADPSLFDAAAEGG